METEEHRTRHIELHRALDELVADFMQSRITNGGEYLPSKIVLWTLMDWSHVQTQNPEDTHNPREASACLRGVLDEEVDRAEMQIEEALLVVGSTVSAATLENLEGPLKTIEGEIDKLAKIARLRKGGPTDFFCGGCGERVTVSQVTCGKCCARKPGPGAS